MGKKLFVVLHIPKTAGTTLSANFARNFRGKEMLQLYAHTVGLDQGVITADSWDVERIRDYLALNFTEQTKCLFGHAVYLGCHKLISRDVEPYYITFLRDPVSRLISTYNYLRNDSRDDRWRREIADYLTVEEWIEGSNNIRRHNGQLRRILLDEDPSILRVPSLTTEHLERGKDRLRQFDYVGLTEFFSDDSLYLYGKLGFRSFHADLRLNTARAKSEVSAETKQYIADRNELDMELYDFACQLRAQFIKEHGWEFRTNVFKAAQRVS